MALPAGVKQLLPAQGSLELVRLSAEGRARPGAFAWPLGLAQPNYLQVAPGYCVPFEEVVRWKPTGYRPGKRVPATICAVFA